MSSDHPTPIPSPAAPPLSRPYERIIALAGLTILGVLAVIFMAMPVGMPPELGLNLGFSLSSVDISISFTHGRLVTIESARMKLFLSLDSQLALSRPSLVTTTFPPAPSCVTSLQAKAQTTLSIVNDLALNRGELKINVEAKAKQRLRLGKWWVAVLAVDVSCSGVTLTAPSDSEGDDNRFIFEGTLSFTIDVIPQ